MLFALAGSCPEGCVFSQDVWIEYKTGAEIDEKEYSSYSGISYPAGGYVVQNIQDLFKSPPTVASAGVFPIHILLIFCSYSAPFPIYF